MRHPWQDWNIYVDVTYTIVQRALFAELRSNFKKCSVIYLKTTDHLLILNKMKQKTQRSISILKLEQVSSLN